jgi:hypothetical protein
MPPDRAARKSSGIAQRAFARHERGTIAMIASVSCAMPDVRPSVSDAWSSRGGVSAQEWRSADIPNAAAEARSELSSKVALPVVFRRLPLGDEQRR